MSVVKLFLLLSICVFAIPNLNAFVKWNSLKATWCPPNVKDTHCFQDIPRTVEKALNNGWRRVNGSTCRNGGKFFGHRMVKGDDYALTPLYDCNGVIAGVQVNVLQSELLATPDPYKFSEVSDFLDNSIEGHLVYSLTTYFIMPNHICSSGRSERQLQIEGTASRIYFQTGRSPKHLREIPLYRNVASKTYTNTNCVSTMGHHNHYDVPSMQLSNCTEMIPSFLLFNNNGELHGFGYAIIGKLSSLRLEHPNGAGIKVTLDPITPECVLSVAESPSLPGFSNIHFFLSEEAKNIVCAPIHQTEVFRNLVYINPNVFNSKIN